MHARLDPVFDASRYQALVAAARRALPTQAVPCFGVLGVERAGRTRTLLLGPHTAVGGEVDIIDWRRAPLAQAFFAHDEGEDFELDVDGRPLAGRVVERALLTVERGELAEVERGPRRWSRDRGWIGDEAEPPHLPDRGPELRGPRGPIQLDADQQRAVDLPSDRSLLLLGEAGFGKTTVALHRLAAVARTPALVLVPTQSLVRLSRRLLDALGARGVELDTLERWILARARAVFPGLPTRDARGVTPAIARLKRHPALRTVLPEIARRARRGARRSDLLHLFGDRALMERVVAEAAGTIPRHAIEEVLEHTHVQFSRTSEDAHAHVDADRLVTLDGRAIDDGTPMEDAGTLDAEDAPVLFELARLRGDPAIGRRYAHLVIDEAQELAPLELAVVGRACAVGGAITVAGDAEQHTDPAALFFGWARTMEELGLDGHAEVTLARNYRCPPVVTALARGLVGRGPVFLGAEGPLVRTRCPSACALDARLVAEIRRLEASDPTLSIAVVTRGAPMARALHARLSRVLVARLALGGDIELSSGVSVTCVEEVKGLELDVVIIPDADDSTYPDDAPSRRALYVAVTRALHAVWLLTAAAWSPCLEGAASSGDAPA